MSQRHPHECLNYEQGSIKLNSDHLLKSVVNMGDESSMVLANEFDAWDQHVEQYEFAYAFIRVRDALKEREWINSFGEIILERASGHNTLFVFFSDLEISIVEKILEDNVRTFKKDRAALEVLVQAWTQSCEEKREINNLVADAENAVHSGTFEAGEPDAQDDSRCENEAAERAFLEHRISKLSLSLAEALVAPDDDSWVERASCVIQSLTDTAAQQGSLSLFKLFQQMDGLLRQATSESLSPDRATIEVLRDHLAVARQMLGVLDRAENSGQGASTFYEFLHSLRPSHTVQLNDSFQTDAQTQSTLWNRALYAAGNLYVDSVRLTEFRDDLFNKEVERQFESQLTAIASSISRHCFELQQTFSSLTTMTAAHLVGQYRNKDLFCSTTEAFFALIRISGGETRVPSRAAHIITDCFDHVIEFLKRRGAAGFAANVRQKILGIDFRKTSHDIMISFVDLEDNSFSKDVCHLIQSFVSERGSSIRVSAAVAPSSGLTIAIPIDSVTSHNLLVESHGEQIALCSRSLIETGCIAHNLIQRVGNKRFVPFRDGVIPLASLHELLGFGNLRKTGAMRGKINRKEQFCGDEKLEYVVSKVAGEFIAFEVEAVCGQREMVVRPLSHIMPRFNGLLGASVIDEKKVALVVDTAQVYDMKGVSRGEYARKIS